MEKLLYPVWKPESSSADAFRDALLAATGDILDEDNLRGLRICVADSAVETANTRRMAATRPVPDGVVSVWLDNAARRQPVEAWVEKLSSRHSCYLVTEAEPIVNTRHPAKPGERVYGMCHVVFLQIPPRLSREQWLQIWQGSHGQVAIDTQSTFGYRQNVIVRGMSYAPPPLDAMIEENFPPAAMTSDYAFYAVEEGDDEGLQKNLQAMLESCARFIDMDRIDVIPMSEYVVKPLAGR